jgi:hypothetical protein
LLVHTRVVEPQVTEVEVLRHWLVVEQLLVTPSQVTEEVPTVQVVVPLQETVWEGAEQKSSQGRGEQMRSSVQALLQLWDAVHPATAGAGSRAAMTKARSISGRMDDRIFFMAFSSGRWRAERRVQSIRCAPAVSQSRFSEP